MTDTHETAGGEPILSMDVELYLMGEFQRFALEAQGDIPEARDSETYLGALAAGRMAFEAEDSDAIVTAFSGFLMSELVAFSEQGPFMKRMHEAGLSEEDYLAKGRMFGSLITHGLDMIAWSEQDDAEITAWGFVCWNIAQHLVDSIDGYDKLRHVAEKLSENGLAA
jgi:hypothetical protein